MLSQVEEKSVSILKRQIDHINQNIPCPRLFLNSRWNLILVLYFLVDGNFPKQILVLCPVFSPRPVSTSLVDDGFGILHKVVYQDRPGSLQTSNNNFSDGLSVLSPHLLVVVPEVVIDGGGEVQQEVPGVFGNRSFMMFLQKCVPERQELESNKKAESDKLPSPSPQHHRPLTFQPWQYSSKREPCPGPDLSERGSWHSWRWTGRILWISSSPRSPSPGWVISVLTCPASHNLASSSPRSTLLVWLQTGLT